MLVFNIKLRGNKTSLNSRSSAADTALFIRDDQRWNLFISMSKIKECMLNNLMTILCCSKLEVSIRKFLQILESTAY